jgi:hypothetical protein
LLVEFGTRPLKFTEARKTVNLLLGKKLVKKLKTSALIAEIGTD